ncbi:hypothetical protein AZE42_03784 [Rhizopogon vesiculosus]|uniref:Zinc finger C3HC4 RING-type domain-containing protein n=1 Tax=Rhizopogon vesiculosus TaxID=180088 RepID=A0A1J8PGA9_9AGAM|nr:hypothetical protein AZE42_03784 [Rhizopogon vesiculosus]
MATNSDMIDLTTSPTLPAPLPAPSTSRNRHPRSANSSRSPKPLGSQGSRHASSVTSEEIFDTSLLPDAEEDLSLTLPVASASTQFHGRKRRRVDVSGEEQQSNIHQLGEPNSSPPDNNILGDISEASTSSQVASGPLRSTCNMSPHLMLRSPSPLDEELERAESPPLTQESVVSQAYSDTGANMSEVSVLAQRGTPLSASETTDATSGDLVVDSPALPQRGTSLLTATADATPDEVVVISPALPLRRIPSSLRPIIIDDPIPLDMVLASTPKPAASHSLPVSPVNATSSSSSVPEPLSAYTCPICFSPPTNATLTPCGHICCGACLFAAVKSTVKRNMVIAMDRAPVPRSILLPVF